MVSRVHLTKKEAFSLSGAFGDGLPDNLVEVDGRHLTITRVAARTGGQLWFRIGFFSGHPVVMPRLARLDPDADLPFAVRAALCPWPTTSPKSLVHANAAMIGKPAPFAGAAVTVPIDAVERRMQGIHGGKPRSFDLNPHEAMLEVLRCDLMLDRPTTAHNPRRANARIVEEREHKRLQNLARDLRGRLAANLVFPWACFRNGKVPWSRNPAWWDRPEVAAFLNEWDRQGPDVVAEWEHLGVREHIDLVHARTRSALVAVRAADAGADHDAVRTLALDAYQRAA